MEFLESNNLNHWQLYTPLLGYFVIYIGIKLRVREVNLEDEERMLRDSSEYKQEAALRKGLSSKIEEITKNGVINCHKRFLLFDSLL